MIDMDMEQYRYLKDELERMNRKLVDIEKTIRDIDRKNYHVTLYDVEKRLKHIESRIGR